MIPKTLPRGINVNANAILEIIFYIHIHRRICFSKKWWEMLVTLQLPTTDFIDGICFTDKQSEHFPKIVAGLLQVSLLTRFLIKFPILFGYSPGVKWRKALVSIQKLFRVRIVFKTIPRAVLVYFP
jgi:hypothetical protein